MYLKNTTVFQVGCFLYAAFIPIPKSFAYPVSGGACELAEAKLKPGEKSERIINQRMIQANAHVPQKNEIVNAILVSTYLTRPVSARELARETTKEEMDAVETAMNGAHKKCGVSYRSQRARDFAPNHKVVTRESLVDLIEGQRIFALNTIADSVDAIKAGPNFPDPRRLYASKPADKNTLAAELDIFFLDANNSQHVAKLVMLGQAVENAFVHPRMKTAINEYQNLLRTRAAGNPVAVEESRRISDQIPLTMVDLVAAESGPSMPNWPAAEIKRLVFMMMRSKPEYFE